MRIVSLLLLVFASTGCQPSPVGSNGPNAADSPDGETEMLNDPLVATLQSTTVNDLTSLSVQMTDFSVTPYGRKKKIDLLPYVEKILPLLKESRLVDSGQIGVGMAPTGSIVLATNDGARLELDLYPFGFFINGKEIEPAVYIYHSELTYFWNALKYDSDNRVYSEIAYRDLLFEYASGGGVNMNMDALSELTKFKDSRAVSLVPEYLIRDDSLLLSLTNLEEIDDPLAIAAVCRHLYSDDINSARFAADVLESWGQIDELHRRTFSPQPADLKNVDGNSSDFCTHMAHWYAENGKYSNAVKTIRTLGLGRFQINRAFCLLRPLQPRTENEFGRRAPAPTESERLEILLLMADFVENRSGDLYVLFLRDLWNALGVQYDVDVEKMVPRNEDGEDFFRNEHDGKKAADAIREWLAQQRDDAG